MTTTKTKPARRGATTVLAATLAAAIRAVAPAVSTRHSTGGRVYLGERVEATDGELRITVATPVSDQAVLVPHAKVAAILGTVSGDVRLQPEASLLRVSASRGQWSLPTEQAEEWPTAAEGDLRPFARFPADEFARAVRAVIDAADTESSRYALGGVLLEHKGPHVAFVATDGRRLNCCVVDIDQDTDDGSVIVPARVMHVLLRVAEAAGDEALQLCAVGNREIVAEVADTVVRAALLEGRFPRWLDVIPADVRPAFGEDDTTYREPPAHVEVSAGDLLSCVRQAAIVTSEQSKGVQFTFTSEGLMLSGRSAEFGESTVTADLAVAGIACSVKLDPAFVASWLRQVDTAAMVEVYATDAESAVVMRHEDCYSVVMPLAAD